MKVYVETNFVLELALDQEDCESCAAFLQLASTGVIQLAIPAYALLEPYETLTRRLRDWKQLGHEVQRHFGQLRRNPQLVSDVEALRELTVRAVDLARDGHESVRRQLLETATILPIDKTTLEKAEALRVSYGLELPDAVMLGAVLLDSAGVEEESFFVNKNTKDFADPRVVEELRGQRCRHIGNFANALQAVRPAVGRSG